MQFASRFENQAHVRRRNVPFFGGGGGETCVFYLLVFNIFFSGCISFSCVVFVC